MARVALTGATGFVGRSVVKLLSERGHTVRALARDPSKLIGVEAIQGDLADTGALRRLAEGADAFIHIAGAIAAPSPAAFFAINEAGTRNAAQSAHDVRRFIHISSLAAREPQLGAYGASKRAGERALEGRAAAIIRPPAVYGPGDRSTLPLLKSLMGRIAVVPGRAEGRMSLIHVDDLARMIADAAAAHWTGTREVSDGTPGGYCWRDLTAAIAASEGRAITPFHVPRWLAGAIAASGLVPSLTAAKIAELYHPDWAARGEPDPGFERMRFQEGFTRTVRWYRAQGWLKPARRADRSGGNTEGDAAT